MEVRYRGSSSASRVYPLSTGPALPEWTTDRARRNLSKRDESLRRRIDLLQDFAMPCSSSKLAQSPDGRYLYAGGTYPPRVRCYDLDELCMKFERYCDSDVLDVAFLGDDYGKVAVLRGDRTVEFHAPYGCHASVRIPTFGRAMVYERSGCELLVACSGGGSGSNRGGAAGGGGEVYRINLEEGRFSAPLVYSPSSSSSGGDGFGGSSSAFGASGSSIAISPARPLAALGCEDGVVRFWDTRRGGSSSDLRPFLHLDVMSSTSGYGYHDGESTSRRRPGEVTSLSFDDAGVQMAAGTAGGCVALYDVRSSVPLHVKEHQYGMPVHTVRFHGGSGCVLSCDARLVKCWRARPGAESSSSSSSADPADATTTSGEATGGTAGIEGGGGGGGGLGSVVANVEGTSDLTHFVVAGDSYDPTGQNSGLILCSGEQPRCQSFYVPALGPAPRWCSFLDSITEELEERDLTTSTTTDGAAAVGGGDGGGGAIYGDYKFLTRDEIDRLGVSNLVGTPLLRGYMHGFFVDVGLYNRLRAVADPFEYEEYRRNKVRRRVEEARASRIAPKSSSDRGGYRPEVNPGLAERLERRAGDRTRAGRLASGLLGDERFGRMFDDPDYEIDEGADEFKLRNPSGVAAARIRRRREEDVDSDRDDDDDEDDGGAVAGGFRRAYDDDDNGGGGWGSGSDGSASDGDDGGGGSDDDDDSVRGARVRGEAYEEMRRSEKKREGSGRRRGGEEEGAGRRDPESERGRGKSEKYKRGRRRRRRRRNVMYEADVDGDGGGLGGDDADRADRDAVGMGLGDESAASSARRRGEEMGMSLRERVRLRKEREAKSGVVDSRRVRAGKGGGASREVTYVPRDARRKMEAAAARGGTGVQEERGGRGEGRGGRSRKRRGVADLGFKTPFKNKA